MFFEPGGSFVNAFLFQLEDHVGLRMGLDALDFQEVRREHDDLGGFRGVIDVLLDGEELAIQRGYALEGVSNEGGQAGDEAYHVGVWDLDEHRYRGFDTHKAAVLIWSRALHKVEHFHCCQSTLHFGVTLIDDFGKNAIGIWPLFIPVSRGILS